jgi:hypothetical protein
VKRGGLTVLLITVGLSLLVILPQIGGFSHFKTVQDAASYIRMAEGNPDNVLLHHARRMFHPLVVGSLRWIAGTDIAFLIVGILSLFLFLWIVLTYLHLDWRYSFPACFGFVFLPYLFVLFHDLYLQTLFFLALSAVFWYLILKKRYLAGVSLLFLMGLTRDETVIIAAAFIVVILLKKQKDLTTKPAWLFSGAVLLTTGFGAFLTSFLTRSNTNLNKLSQLLFSVLRLPLFLFENLTGLQHWLDTYKVLPDYTHPPMFVFDLPAWFQKFSAIKQAGIYEWNLILPATLILLILSAFGTGPTILYFFWKKTKFKELRGSLALNAMLLFGCLIFVLSPALGPPVIRYFVNAWPLFFLVMPVLLKTLWTVDKGETRRILGIYFISSWFCVFTFLQLGLPFTLISILIEIPLHVYTWRRLNALFAGVKGRAFGSPLARGF